MESYFVNGKDCCYMAHSPLRVDHPTILILHGLGDSSLSYRAFLTDTALQNYNILIPDLLGYGKSSGSSDYAFEHQITSIIEHINYLAHQFNIDFSNIFLLSHSMGSIHATLLCHSILKNKIAGFINVEGSITQYGAFISSNVFEAVKNNCFDSWFTDFKENKIYLDLGIKDIAYRQYYASLKFCTESAFKQNGLEMYQMAHELQGQKYTHIIGEKYLALQLPKIYCYGNSMCNETIEFLRINKLEMKHCNFEGHFFMPNYESELASFIKEFIAKI